MLTGPSGVGKTTVCRRIVELARRRGLRVAGLLSESHRLASGRLVQTAVNLRTGERRRLAEHVGSRESKPMGGGADGVPPPLSWRFVDDSVRWGRRELEHCADRVVDLLVVDQLGPLELTIGSGWTNAVETLTSTPAALALVVVNPLVVDELLRRPGLRDGTVIEVSEANREALPGCLARTMGWEPGREPAGERIWR